MTIGMAQEALTRGATSLNTGLDTVKRAFIPVVIASVLLCIIIGIGFMLLFIPGLVALFFLLFTLPAVVLDNFGAVDAIKKSIDIVKANVFRHLVLFIALIVIWIIFAIVTLFFELHPAVGAVGRGIPRGYRSAVMYPSLS